MSLKPYIFSTDINESYVLTFVDPDSAGKYGLKNDVILGVYSGSDFPNEILDFKINEDFKATVADFIKGVVVPELDLGHSGGWVYLIDQRSPKSQESFDVIAGVNDETGEVKINPNYKLITGDGVISFGGEFDEKFLEFINGINNVD